VISTITGAAVGTSGQSVVSVLTFGEWEISSSMKGSPRLLEKAILALSQLDAFVGNNFFTSDMPNDNDRLVLHHDLRDSPNEAERDRYWNLLVPELNKLIDAAWEAYGQYRATVKKRLMV
jgi:hypothetical protein